MVDVHNTTCFAEHVQSCSRTDLRVVQVFLSSLVLFPRSIERTVTLSSLVSKTSTSENSTSLCLRARETNVPFLVDGQYSHPWQGRLRRGQL